MTGFASSSAASSAIRCSVAGSLSSISNRLPCLTAATWPNPSRRQALAMASPCGSWISGFSITLTTNLGTSEQYASSYPSSYLGSGYGS